MTQPFIVKIVDTDESEILVTASKVFLNPEVLDEESNLLSVSCLDIYCDDGLMRTSAPFVYVMNSSGKTVAQYHLTPAPSDS